MQVSGAQRACIIGAGSSGITAVKALKDRGIPFDCFEKGDRIGGLWVFENKTGLSAAYRSLHINTSRDRMAFADFPMPADYPDFPHHSLIAKYFERYADTFGLRPLITFDTSVTCAERRPGGGYFVTLSTGETREYEALIVANGHHWHPRPPVPPIPGTFDGVEIHSHEYVDGARFAGKRVVVVGMGNSAMDIVVEVSQVARAAFLAMRRGAHIVPKYLFGRPLDQFLSTPHVPLRVRQAVFSRMLRIAVGPVERYGLPTPDHRVLEAHPTISSDIFLRLGSGDVLPKPAIAERLGDRVRFTDGTIEEVDAIIYCTGYRVSFPFFDTDFLAAPDNELPLFLRMWKPGLADLMFVGLLQPLGAVMPLAEAQSKWIATYLAGEYALPDEAEMQRSIDRDRAAMKRRYVGSPRHTIQVDFDDYLDDLRREVARGQRRARRR